MVTGYLWLRGLVPVATAIHIVSCLVRSLRGGQSSFFPLKGAFCPLLAKRQHPCLAVVSAENINSRFQCINQMCSDGARASGIGSLFESLLCCSGKTEYQATHAGRLRRASTFERRPSKRYPSRTQSLGKGEPDVEGSQQNL